MNALKSLFRRHRSQNRRRFCTASRRGSWLATEQLEVRNMLAGNVLAVVSTGGDLILRGDAQSNSVDVVIVNGDVVVQGRDSTTINGAATPFTAVAGSTTIAADFIAHLGRGNDVLFVEGITVTGRAVVASHRGNDSIGFEGATVGRNLHIRTAHGTDVVDLKNTSVGRDLLVHTGKHNDTIHIANSSVGDDVRIVTGRHDDAVVLDTVTIGDELWASTGAGADDVVLMNSSIGGRLRARTHGGSDFVMIDATTVSGRANLRTHGKHDLVIVENASQFGALTVNTGAGRDASQVDPSTVVTGRLKQRRSEAVTVSAADRERELNDPTTGALTRSNAVAAFFNALSTTPDVLTLAVDVSGNGAVQSNGTLVTNDSSFRLAVATQAGATVAVDSDGDGQFDDGTTTADSSGNATLDVTLLHDASNNGANTLNVQASNNQDTPLTEQVDVHLSQGTVVRFDSTLGAWDVELFDTDAPNTVGAFLDNLSRQDNSISHRNVDGFIIQGGGFAADASGSVQNIASFPAPPNEFNQASPLNSNVRGTISTAQNSNINSFTGQWFINTIDNIAGSPINNLDGVPHTVFGRVIGTGMTVVDAINNTPVFDISGIVTGSGASALQQTPLINYTAGTVPALDSYIRINSVTELLTPLGTQNTFRVFENSSTGTAVGNVTAATTSPVIFEFADPALASQLRLNQDDHLEGDAAATTVLIEYLSLQCPSCAAAHPDVEQLLVDNPNDVVVVRRHLPLDTSTGGAFEHSFEAALAAEAAGRQGRFDEMVDQLFARQAEWNNSFTSQQAQAVFEDIAVTTLGLNLTQFNADMSDQALTDRINRDIADAAALGATGTPTFFLNGQQTAGTPDSAAVQSAVQTLNRSFALDRRTGALTVADSGGMNFEVNPSFSFDVTATNGTTETIPTTVNLIDVFTG